jgi:hypothetical protein
MSMGLPLLSSISSIDDSNQDQQDYIENYHESRHQD